MPLLSGQPPRHLPFCAAGITVSGREPLNRKVCIDDAWWIPPSASSTLPIRADIMTPHHPRYYASKPGRVPNGTGAPIPVSFPVVIGATFRLWLTGEQHWCEAAEGILRHSLYTRGIGAKAATGYGHSAADYPPLEASPSAP